MVEGASFALGPPRPRVHGIGALICFGTTEAPTAWARGPPQLRGNRGPHGMGQGPPSLWDHQGPHLIGVGASLALGPPKAHTAWAMEPPSLWDNRGPHCMDAGASFALGPLRPPFHGREALLCFGTSETPPHGRGGLIFFGTTEAPTAWTWGPHSL